MSVVLPLTHVIVTFFTAGLALAFFVTFGFDFTVAFLLGVALAFLLGAIVVHVTTDFAPFFAGGAVTHLMLGLGDVALFG